MARMKITVFLFVLLLFPISSLAQQPTMPVPDGVVLAEEDVPAMAPAAVVTDAGPTEAKDAKTEAVDVKKAEKEVKPPQPVGPPHKQPETVVEALQEVNFMIEAAKNGWWGIFAGILIMLLVFILDKLVGLKKRVGKKAVPWVAAVFGIVAAIGVALTTGVHWGQAILQGLTAGISAVGLWELIFQHIEKKDPAAEG